MAIDDNPGDKSLEKIVVWLDAEIKELIPNFLKNRNKDVCAIRKALAEGDFETIRLRGHSMRGSGEGYGFKRISEIGIFLEKAGETKDGNKVKRWIKALESYLDRVEINFK